MRNRGVVPEGTAYRDEEPMWFLVPDRGIEVWYQIMFVHDLDSQVMVSEE